MLSNSTHGSRAGRIGRAAALVLVGFSALGAGGAGGDLRDGAGRRLEAFYSITGHVSVSVDAGGSATGPYLVQVRKPNAAAKVLRAYLLAATVPWGGVIPDGGVRLGGGWVSWEDRVSGAIYNDNFRANVTALVKPTVDAAAPGLVNFVVSEPYGYAKIDGVVLAVVFEDPAVADFATVALLSGSQAVAGDTFTITLAEPIDPAEPGAVADMGLAISWSTGGTQRSLVDVQGVRMTSSAGGYNDGASANGAYITGGGIGDSNANPPDPLAQGTSAYDDELYTLLPYITPATDEIVVYTLNPSNDDNIFFAYFYLSTSAIITQRIMLLPLTADREFGTLHTLTATVEDFTGTQMVDVPVTLTVIAGPNAGKAGVVFTDGTGSATWSYVGDGGEGTDQIQASFVDAEGDTVRSNIVICSWVITNHPPVAEAGGPYAGVPGSAVLLDGTGSYDSDPGDAITYAWDLDHDGQFDDSGDPRPTLLLGEVLPGTVYTVCLRVTDLAGLSDEDCATVTVSNRAPVCDAGGPYAAECAGAATAVTLDGTGSWDPDTAQTLTYAWSSDAPAARFDNPASPTPRLTFNGSCQGTYGVTLTVRDNSNASATCSAAVTVADTAPPAFTVAPADATFECNGSGNTAEIGAWLASAAATDGCGAVSVTHDYAGLSDGCGGTGSATVRWTATDACGWQAEHTATVTVVDRTPPTFTLKPATLTLPCGDSANPARIGTWLASAAAADTCGAVTVTHDYAGLSDGCGDSGSATVTWTAADACGNVATHAAVLAVVDTAPPTITVPAAGMTVDCDAAGDPLAALDAWLAGHGGAAATDSCGAVSWSHDFAGLSDGCGATGAATVTFTASDECGNTATTAATFRVRDTTPPTIAVPAGDATVECDGAGNAAELAAWLAAHGGAQADDACGAVSWTHNFAGLSDGCGATGAATVTFTATDECGNAASTTAGFQVADTTPPVFTVAPTDIAFESDGQGNVADIQAWLDSAAAADECGGVTVTHDYAGLDGGDGVLSATVTWTATDACGNAATHTATVTIIPVGEAKPGELGSVLVWPNVEIRWDAAGRVLQDTYLMILNDYKESVRVQFYFVNGDAPLGADPGSGEPGHPGWNRVDNQITLTPNETAWWSALTGQPKGVSPFTVLDPGPPPGRPDPEAPGSGQRVLRGYVIGWAVDGDSREIRWNYLLGSATVMNYAATTGWDYPAWAFQSFCVPHGEQVLDCVQTGPDGRCVAAQVIPGRLDFDGFQYDFAPGHLLLNFVPSGATTYSCCGRTASHDTDLTLYLADQDMRAGHGPFRTLVETEVWNQDGVGFRGPQRCITCWNQGLFSSYGGPFLMQLLQSDVAYVRINGIADPSCPGSIDAALLATANRVLDVAGAQPILSGSRFTIGGRQAARFQWDVPGATEEKSTHGR